MAFVMGPLAGDMFLERPTFRWVGLMHRDGNALPVNDLLNASLDLPERRKDRTPDGSVARVLKEARAARGEPTLIGVPHLLSTHLVVLYRYLHDDPCASLVAIHLPQPCRRNAPRAGARQLPHTRAAEPLPRVTARWTRSAEVLSENVQIALRDGF